MKTHIIKIIVVGVDLSPYSKTVVREARELSSKFKVPMVCVYVFPEAVLFTDALAVRKAYVSEFYAKEIRRFYGLNAEDQVIVRYGRAHVGIIAAAKTFKSPMIVAGYRGHNPLARLFIGSTAERLALNSPFPTWIHRGKRAFVPKNILIPCDLTPRSTRTIESILPIQKLFKAKLGLYHVMQEPIPVMDYVGYTKMYQTIKNEDEKRVQTFRKKHPALKTDAALGSIGSKIAIYAKKFDLVAVSPKNRRKPALFGGVTETLLRSGNTPVLVIP